MLLTLKYLDILSQICYYWSTMWIPEKEKGEPKLAKWLRVKPSAIKMIFDIEKHLKNEAKEKRLRRKERRRNEI